MTPDDVRDLIKNISLHASELDKTHLKQLVGLLTAKCEGKILRKNCNDAQYVLQELEQIAPKLVKSDIKKLYRVAIECDMAPKCYACNLPITHIKDFSWDHVYPHSKGGSDKLYNLVPMHKSCNARKGAQVFEDLLSVQYTLILEPIVVIIERKEMRKHKKNRKIKRLKPWNCKTRQR